MRRTTTTYYEPSFGERMSYFFGNLFQRVVSIVVLVLVVGLIIAVAPRDARGRWVPAPAVVEAAVSGPGLFLGNMMGRTLPPWLAPAPASPLGGFGPRPGPPSSPWRRRVWRVPRRRFRRLWRRRGPRWRRRLPQWRRQPRLAVPAGDNRFFGKDVRLFWDVLFQNQLRPGFPSFLERKDQRTFTSRGGAQAAPLPGTNCGFCVRVLCQVSE